MKIKSQRERWLVVSQLLKAINSVVWLDDIELEFRDVDQGSGSWPNDLALAQQGLGRSCEEKKKGLNHE